MTDPKSPADPLWYKDAVIYQLHVKSFFDANNDGVGDFRGPARQARLHRRTRRHRDLAAAVLPQPAARRRLRHRRLPRRASRIRHARATCEALHLARRTSAASGSSPNSSSTTPPISIRGSSARAQRGPARSPATSTSGPTTTSKYAGTRVIFVDTEKSNWTWDPTAGAYFWHRFYSHQPDLNFDNPRVLQEVLSVMRFWLDLGVDGLRLDAVPYLVEREGTNNENLPETHAILKRIRAELDRALRPAACCSPRPTSGRRTRSSISATATNATWRSTSR